MAYDILGAAAANRKALAASTTQIGLGPKYLTGNYTPIGTGTSYSASNPTALPADVLAKAKSQGKYQGIIGGMTAGGGGGVGLGGGVGTGDGAGGMDPSAVYNAWQAKQDAANAANEQRYKDILAGREQLYNDVLGQLEGSGTQAMSDVTQRSKESQALMEQDLSRRGLGNTTVMPSMAMGLNREAEAQRQRIQEGVRQQKADAMQRMKEGTFGTMERREDVAPDPRMYADLLSNMGGAQGNIDAYGNWSQQMGAQGATAADPYGLYANTVSGYSGPSQQLTQPMDQGSIWGVGRATLGKKPISGASSLPAWSGFKAPSNPTGLAFYAPKPKAWETSSRLEGGSSSGYYK